MSETKHTPGPWEVEEDGVDGFKIKSVDYGGIASLHDPIAPETHRMDEVEADAHLIAAAPDLLAVCEKTLRFVGHTHDKFRDEIKAAIAKAKP